MRCEVSTTLPSTLPARAAFARPGPIDAATSATETGASNRLMLPSGRVMLGMAFPFGVRRIPVVGAGPVALEFVSDPEKKSAGEPHFFGHSKDRRTCALAF